VTFLTSYFSPPLYKSEAGASKTGRVSTGSELDIERVFSVPPRFNICRLLLYPPRVQCACNSLSSHLKTDLALNRFHFPPPPTSVNVTIITPSPLLPPILAREVTSSPSSQTKIPFSSFSNPLGNSFHQYLFPPPSLP